MKDPLKKKKTVSKPLNSAPPQPAKRKGAEPDLPQDGPEDAKESVSKPGITIPAGTWTGSLNELRSKLGQTPVVLKKLPEASSDATGGYFLPSKFADELLFVDRAWQIVEEIVSLPSDGVRKMVLQKINDAVKKNGQVRKKYRKAMKGK